MPGRFLLRPSNIQLSERASEIITRAVDNPDRIATAYSGAGSGIAAFKPSGLLNTYFITCHYDLLIPKHLIHEYKRI